MKLTIDITREDYADYNKFHFVKTRLKRSIIVILATLIIVEIFLNKDKFDLTSTIISSIAGVGMYVFIIYRSFNKIKKIPVDGGHILGQKEIEFTEEKYYSKTKNSEGSAEWSTIKSIEENKKSFYLYVDKNMAIMVPKRVFKDETEMNEFRNLVTRKIKEA